MAELALKQRGHIQLTGETQPLWRSPREEPDSCQLEHDRLFKAILDHLPHSEAERGAHSTLTAIMGRNAAVAGQMVTWDEALNADENLVTAAETRYAEPPILPGPNGEYPIPMPKSTAG